MNEEEVRQKCQEACIDEQGVPGQTQAQKRKPTQRGSKDRSPERKAEKLSEQPGIRLGKLKP